MKISSKMGLNKSVLELDFYDYTIGKDTFKFLDPYYISKQEDTFLCECRSYIRTFFNRFLFLLANKEEEALELFSHLGEVNEICLGMSRGRPRGRGVGKNNSIAIFNAIKNSDAFKNGVAREIEDVRLFVEGVDKDKLSDMIANIIKYPLIKYTQRQCQLLGVQTEQSETGYYWNNQTSLWEKGYEEMLILEDKTYLLFPKNIVSSSKYYSADYYFRMFVLEYLQQKNIDEDTVLVRKRYNKDGTIAKKWVCKKDIVKAITSRGERITKNWLANFSRDNPDVYRKFRAETINRISDGVEINKDEYKDIIEKIMDELKSIPYGVDGATKYHHLISGILELVLYPQAAHPELEAEIHDGRKRIDIKFCNIAQKGFFYLLGTDYNVPCANIMIECKNYTKDIANPELDQMAGRFSANRGKFGIICCRQLNDEEKFIERERDTVKDGRGFIIHLTDADIIELLKNIKENEDTDAIFHNKYNQIVV